MEQAKRVAKNTGFLYARMAITVFISLYVTRLVLAALGAEDFGTFSVVGGAIAMLTFLNAAMTAASQRFMSYAQGEGNNHKQKNIFNVSVLLHFFIAIAVVLLLEGAGYIFFNGLLKINPERIYAAKLIYQFLIASTFFTIISVPYDAVINAHENMFFVAVLGIIESLLKLGIALFITYTVFDKLISYGFLMALLAIFLLLIRRVYCHRKYEEVEINLRKYYSKPLFKEMMSFASWSFLGSSSSLFANYGQGIVINIFFGTVVNAAQGVSNQVNGQLSAFANTMMKALNPVLAISEGAGNRDLMIKASMIGSKISFFLLIIFFIPILIETPYILNIWLKDVPEFAAIFCQLLLIRSLIEQLFKTLASSISAHGKIRNYQVVSSILCYLPLVFSFILFKMGSPAYYLYIVFIIYTVLASCIILFFTWNNFRFPVQEFLKNVVLRSIVTFIVIYFVSYMPIYFFQEGFFRLCFVIILCLISYPISIWFIGLTSNDKSQFRKLVFPLLEKYLPVIFFKNKNK
jgi:O-antigen/teichoic acid export membrane protein